LERQLGLIERQQRGTILAVAFFFDVVFAPVLRQAPLNELETIERNGSPREPFLFCAAANCYS
jgi:hypothetical protein